MPRLTFLARFTLATLVAAITAACILAFLLEGLHQRAVERDEIVNAISEIDAAVAAPLSDEATHGSGPAIAAAFALVRRMAMLHQYVADIRIYRNDGRAVYPPGALDDPSARAAAPSDAFVSIDRNAIRTIYQPFVTDKGRPYVIEVDFVPAQLHAQFAGEAWQVAVATVGVIALISCALIALAAEASRELDRRRRESQTSFVQALAALAETIDLRDPYTAGHSKRVAAYSKVLAEDLGLPIHDVEQIYNAALLHDIGKVGVPDAVLFKPAALDAEERLMIKAHPVIGAGLLRSLPTMHEIIPCVLHHHERVDGHGYPDGLSGDGIPLGARIIAVADAFDAMTTDRPYRRGLATDAAVAELLAQEGTQFDPPCVLAFAELVLRGEIVPPPRASGDVAFGQRAVIERLRATGTAR